VRNGPSEGNRTRVDTVCSGGFAEKKRDGEPSEGYDPQKWVGNGEHLRTDTIRCGPLHDSTWEAGDVQ